MLTTLLPRTRRSLLLGAAGLLALVGTGAAVASAHSPGHGRAGGPLAHLLRHLELSDEQKTQIKALMRDARPRLQPLAAEAMRTRRAVFQAVAAPTFDETAVRAAAEAAGRAAGDLAVERARLTSEVRALLTPEQQARLDEALRRMEERGERRGHMGGRAAWHERAADLVDTL
jgi:protein CpxP